MIKKKNNLATALAGAFALIVVVLVVLFVISRFFS